LQLQPRLIAMTSQEISALRLVLERGGWCRLENGDGKNLHEIAASLGQPITSVGRPLIQSLVPTPKETAPKNSLSGVFGFGEFPPHTDVAHWHTPARYVLLRSVNGKNSIPTLVVDSREFLTHKLRRQWAQATWKVTRIAAPFLCSITFRMNGIEAVRWDPCCLAPYGKRAEALRPEITDKLASAFRESGQAIAWTSCQSVLVIDNWRVLHARPVIVGPTTRRELERILVKGGNDGTSG
jgi:L-asparagine oxygenase